MAMVKDGVLRALLPGALMLAAACGSSTKSDPPNDNATATGDVDAGIAPFGGEGSNNAFGDTRVVASLAIDPPQANLRVLQGTPATQAFKVVATFADGTSAALTRDIVWTVNNFAVGAMDPAGVYRASAEQGGRVSLQAASKGKTATATLDVRLAVVENPDNVSAATQQLLRGASGTDPGVQWAYPYEGTVFPRQIPAPALMWNGGAAADTYLVRLTSPHFELERFVVAPPPARVELPQGTWDRFLESTAGAAELVVARHDGTQARVATRQRWTVAPESMRGTIYYWSNNQGRVLRLRPGSSTPEDFSAGKLNGLPSSGCTMTCHTVSADGSTIVSGGDTLGGTFDLKNGAAYWDEGGGPGSDQKRRWAYAALSPTGKYIVESFAPFPVGFGTQTGLFMAQTKQYVPGSGLDGVRLGTPAFAPDGTLIAYVDYQAGATNGSLKLVDFDGNLGKASNIRELVKKGALPDIAFPSVSPDGKWVVYQRGSSHRTDGGNTANLYLANVQTGQETRLAAINGDGFPFVAGARDLNWNFEPTFAPVASGGYFWVVFTTRRTLGNKMTGDAASTKQLWVAAIDQSPQAGADPSHPAFHLPGQGGSDPGAQSLNMRGFWSLEACRADGLECETGSQCCGGYCDKSNAAQNGGKGQCKSAPPACAQSGDRCNIAADCCDVAQGVSCINHVCSQPAPR